MKDHANDQPSKLSKTITITPSVHADLVALGKRFRQQHDRYVTASEAIRILITAYQAAN
ncbi:hypothetical protein MUN81_10260 [Hymenobacter sp. 5317J-9]|uniref:hypothetical protein n=1 Tax=Hymenobacter sp. 5317J-9 TaxID=2932250 RepID=UPI001FD707F1|nr:hypothetical protein [Hymenobacter sp. 5317J-9]UOQ99861.1 hypothetical protein MUN81_10260 [Hymenobacter sp. 5317J-9]